jgi:hypothetical protein
MLKATGGFSGGMMRKKWLELMGTVALTLLAGACAENGVGDPCAPEKVPPGGFLQSETYLELSSLQCATRVCLVRGLDGDPNNIQEDECPLDPVDDPDFDPNDSTCVPQGDVDESVYCSCRCDAPEGSGFSTCSCPSGFKCEEVLETGGAGIQGSYCVREELEDES